MKRKIGLYGHAYIIKLKPQDLPDHDWEVGDMIDLTDAVIIKQKKSKKNKGEKGGNKNG